MEAVIFDFDGVVLDSETPEYESHRRIYARMVDLAESSRSIDLITLSEELGRHSELDPIGGAAYISSLLDGVPATAMH